ncbi:MAG: MBL fold metallo-hydrolase [Acidimicrobiia bacterium]
MRGRPLPPILRFLGATGTVTGSRFLVETADARVLVDCGLFQGLKALRARNWDRFPVDPGAIDAVVLSHAHVDHTGYVPAIVRDGFSGHVVSSPGTRALAEIVLPDAGHLQEEDAEFANRAGFSKHRPALPLYTEADALRSLERFRDHAGDQPVELAGGVTATLRNAGHILGSSTVALTLDGGRTVTFSGDLGRAHHPILQPPAPLADTDIVVIESTYGSREHDDGDVVARFADAIVRTAKRGGTVVIPAFAVDRTEVILFHLTKLVREGRVPDLPVYVDSPMALAALAKYRDAIASGAPEVRADVAAGDDPFDAGQLHEVRDVAGSKALNEQRYPSVIISASGMATGGRVLHHLAHRLTDSRNTVVLVGFQAEGTRGRLLSEGARNVKMLGRYVPVRAEIVDIPGFSVHADRGELLAWLRTAPREPEAVFVVHGEQSASEALRDAIVDELGWNAAVPRHLEIVRVD